MNPCVPNKLLSLCDKWSNNKSLCDKWLCDKWLNNKSLHDGLLSNKSLHGKLFQPLPLAHKLAHIDDPGQWRWKTNGAAVWLHSAMASEWAPSVPECRLCEQ